jgi:hypothetical protein
MEKYLPISASRSSGKKGTSKIAERVVGKEEKWAQM